MVVFSKFLAAYFGLNYSSLFCVILVSGRRRIYIIISFQLSVLDFFLFLIQATSRRILLSLLSVKSCLLIARLD